VRAACTCGCYAHVRASAVCGVPQTYQTRAGEKGARVQALALASPVLRAHALHTHRRIIAWKSGSSDPWKPPVLCAHCMASLTSLSSILHCALCNPSLACDIIRRSARLARGEITGKRSTPRSGVPPLQAASAGGATPRCAQTRPGPDQAALLCRAQRAFLNALAR